MNDRKAELEAKKARLQEIRDNKRRRENKPATGNNQSSSGSPNVDLRLNTEDLLKDLGLPEPELLKHAAGVNEGSTDINGRIVVASKRKNLQISGIVESSFPPPPSVQYNKEVQTLEQSNERESRPNNYYVLTYEETNKEEIDANATLAELQKMLHIGVTSPNAQKARARPDSTIDGLTTDEPKKPPTLSEDEITQIMLSDDFLRFFDRSSRILERALCEPSDDLFLMYTGKNAETESSDALVTECHTFMDERWSKRRTVTCLDWSAVHPELLLAAYHVNEEALHEPEGVCLIWNLKYAKNQTPEYVFHCQSPLTAATLCKFHPNLVIGATYSGQIVLWDSRSNKRTPVQRSPLTSWAHTHPVYAMTSVGTQNAHHIVTLGSDGSLCAWSLDMLSQPREKTKVCEMSSSGLFDIYPTCMSFFANDVNNYAVGTENGNAYCGQRHSSRTGATEQVSKHVPYKGHCAPITAIHTHPSPGAMSFSSLFLTASLDWTVRLWSTREYKPLHTFEGYSDYVYDACWSPVHPAVFAAVDGTGALDVWNINQDVEVPCARLYPRSNATSADKSSGGGTALNKCRWDMSGSHLAVGDNSGGVTVCAVHESLSQPSADQWTELNRSLADLKYYNTEQEARTDSS